MRGLWPSGLLFVAVSARKLCTAKKESRRAAAREVEEDRKPEISTLGVDRDMLAPSAVAAFRYCVSYTNQGVSGTF